MFIFGLGYAAKRIAAQLNGWSIEATGQDGTTSFDDDDAVRTVLGEQLREMGFQVDTVADALLEALKESSSAAE